MIRLISSVAILLLACMLPATASRAQTCDPFQAIFKMELFPHSVDPIPFFLMLSSTGCMASPGAAHCLAQTVLPADALLLTPQEALDNKCESIVAAIQSNCSSRFLVSDIDCDSTPGQMTQFRVADLECDGQAADPEEGIGLASANELSALSSFDPTGTVLTDYERDTVFPGCPDDAGNMLVISGDGGSGTSIFPGGAASFEIFVTTDQTGTVSHAEATGGVTPEGMASIQANILSQTFLALGDSTVCVANGRTLECMPTGGESAPTMGAVSNDVGMPAALVGGSTGMVAMVADALQNGGCESLEDCGALGQNVPEPGMVVSLAAGSLLLSLLGRRRRSRFGRCR